MITEKLFETREALLDALSLHCLSALSDALGARGQASFMVSGGSSPAPLYRKLSEADLDWASIHVALVDERWVDRDHDKSNETFIVNNLLQNRAAAARLTGMKNAAVTARDGLADCEAAYRALPSPFDLTLLGMGPDGHTASLFPHAEGLSAALDAQSDRLCAAITAQQSEVTGAMTERMTLSLAGLLNSRQLLLLITGEDKLAALRDAQAGDDVAAIPVRAVLQQTRVPLTIYWAP